MAFAGLKKAKDRNDLIASVFPFFRLFSRVFPCGGVVLTLAGSWT
jgi:hypothetical protein